MSNENSDLVQVVDGIKRLARAAKPEEIKRANWNSKNVFVIVGSNGDKNVSFIHVNKIGKKVYKTFKEKIEYPEKRERRERTERPRPVRAPIQQDHIENTKSTIGDSLSKEVLEKLKAISK